MHEHVCARCADHLILFPAENVGAIEPISGDALFCDWTRRRRSPIGAEPVLDLRRLLGAPARAPQEAVALLWRSTDGARRLSLLVDAVEQIVDLHEEDLIDIPLFPRRLRPLCDRVAHDPRGRLRLRVKTDVHPPLEGAPDRRRWVQSLLARLEGARPANERSAP